MSSKGLTKIQVALLIAVIVVAAALSYFAVKFYISPGKTPETYVEDILGRKVAIPQKINRVVAIGPGMLRLVCYLNATDLLVGVEESQKKKPLRALQRIFRTCWLRNVTFDIHC
jgi:iron complex transport system substrate-binding protein